MSRRWRLLTGEAPSLEVYNAAFEPARTPFDWLSRDEAEVDAYIADPLCGFEPTPEFGMSMLAEGATFDDADKLGGIRKELPLLIAAGDKDPLNGGLMLLNGLIEKYKQAGIGDVTAKFYDGARHEILNETNRDEVTADILSWLKERI